MSYHIERISLLARERPPARMTFALGKQTDTSKPAAPQLRTPLGHVQLILSDDRGNKTFGCAGDGLSVRWLDKRSQLSEESKLRELVALIHHARDIYLESPTFDSPFEKWRTCHQQIMRVGRERGQEDLTSSFASALMERALLDAVGRLAKRPLFEMVRENRIGFQPEAIHSELEGLRFTDHLPRGPLTRFYIRHTVGLADPITAADLPADQRVNDGEPETLEEYVRRDGISYFKVKISGDLSWDLDRLARIWQVIPKHSETAVTLDANEAYDDLAPFADFVDRLRSELLGLFQHILYIEQPLSRQLTHDPKAEPWIRRIAQSKPVVIDESDGTLDSFKRAFAMGYAGASHKNCKGFFKSLLNHALIAHYNASGGQAFLSGEDLSNLPIVPLHQDFTALGILGLRHCERNGHHYYFGLSMLTDKEKAGVARHHRDLYVQRGKEWFLNIRNGMVQCPSLQCPGFGVRDEPDWASMTDMNRWIQSNYPG
ncbi:hypothetical protein MYX84_02180 [Acidobacteria bacterium AH-259-O06]|nr:hypothetical protein [Acidobacteria bacterium AH-259-O06]